MLSEAAVRFHSRGFLADADALLDGFVDAGPRFNPFHYHKAADLPDFASRFSAHVLQLNYTGLPGGSKPAPLPALVSRCKALDPAKATHQEIARIVIDACGGPVTSELSSKYDLFVSKAKSPVIPLGSFVAANLGLLRVRAVLFKFLCQQVGLKCSLVRSKANGNLVYNTIGVSSIAILDGITSETELILDLKDPLAQRYRHGLTDEHFLRYEKGGSLVDVPIEYLAGKKQMCEGAFGVIYTAQLNDEKVVMKSCKGLGDDDSERSYSASRSAIAAEEESISDFRKSVHLHELEMLSKLKHPGVIELIGTSGATETSKEFMVLRFCDFGTLKQDKIFSLPLSDKLFMLVHLAETLDYLSCCAPTPVVHRDIKLENVLLRSDSDCEPPKPNLYPVLCDFGLSCEAGTKCRHRMRGFVLGSRPYLSQEIISNKDDYIIANEKDDVYAFGIVMFELLTEKVFEDEKDFYEDTGSVATNIAGVDIQKEVQKKIKEDVSDQLAAIIRSCILPLPERSCITEVLIRLRNCLAPIPEIVKKGSGSTRMSASRLKSPLRMPFSSK